MFASDATILDTQQTMVNTYKQVQWVITQSSLSSSGGHTLPFSGLSPPFSPTILQISTGHVDVCDCSAMGGTSLQWKTTAHILSLLTSSQSLLILEFLVEVLAPIVPMVDKNVDCSQPVLNNGVSAEYLLPYIHNSIYFLQFLIPHCEKALPSPHKQIQTIAPTRCYKQDLLHEHGSNNQRHYGTLSYGDHLRVFLLEVVPCFLAKVFCLFEAKGCQLTLHCSSSLTHGFLPFCFILSSPMELS